MQKKTFKLKSGKSIMMLNRLLPRGLLLVMYHYFLIFIIDINQKPNQQKTTKKILVFSTPS